MSLALMKSNDNIHYLASTTFTIDRKYSDLKAIGKGSYGVVCSALDAQSGKRIAIKKITPMAKHLDNAKHVLREIRLMRHMGKHENIITLEDLIVREDADELYIVMELLDTDLHRVLQSKQLLTENHFKHFLFQLLCGVKYLHENRIIHRDLKPGNLLVTKDCRLRIADFGLARERPTGHGKDPDEQIDEPMTEHVVTRWFRPPELMLCPDGLYTYAVDMWSCGCILGEMLGRKPLFPGKNFVHQLQLIFEVIGSPLPSQVAHITNQQALKFLETQGGRPKMSLKKVFNDASDSALALLDQFLLFDPEDRITVDTALNSEFLWDVRDPGSHSEVYPPTSVAFEFAFERSCASRNDLKLLIHQESASLRKEKRIASGIIGGSSSVSVGSDEDFFECLPGNSAGIIQNIGNNGEQYHREEDGNCRTESDGERDQFRGSNRGSRAEVRIERKDCGTRTVSVGSVDYGLHQTYNNSHINQRDKENDRERERDRERELEREKEKEISMLEAEIKDKKEKQKAYKLVHILERRLSTSSIASKREKVDLKSYSTAVPAYKPSMPSITSSISSTTTLQQQEHLQKEERHIEHQLHQQHLLEQHAKQQKLMQQQLEDLQLKQQQKLLRQQKKRESRATIPGAPNISRPSFVNLTSKQPRDVSSSTLISGCRYGIGIGSVLGGRQENEAEADIVTCDDFAAFSAAALKLALKQRELNGLNSTGTGTGNKGRRTNEWMDPITATPGTGTVGPILSESQCPSVQTADTRSISAERNYNNLDNDLVSISALLDSPISSRREASKRGWSMDVTDDIESQAVLAIMIADRDIEGRRMAKHEGTGTGSHTNNKITHLHSNAIEGSPHAHDDASAVQQSEGQIALCSNTQPHQSHRRRAKHKTSSRMVSVTDPARDPTPTHNSFTNSINSGVDRGSGLDTMYSTICSAILLGQELERLSQQFSPIMQGQGLGLEQGQGLGEEKRLHTTDEKDLNTSSQHQIASTSTTRGPSNASLHIPSAIPTVIKREKTKVTYTNSSDIKDQRGECPVSISRTEQVLVDAGSIRGSGASDRRRVTLPVSPKFSKMSWQRDKDKEKGNRSEEWEGQLQGRGEGGVRSSKQEGNVKDRGILGGVNARRRSTGAPSLKPTSVMMTRQGQLGIGFGTCTTIETAGGGGGGSGSCSGAGNGYSSNHQGGVLERVIGAGVFDVENRTIDLKKEKENGRHTRSSSSSVASIRHMERQVDTDRGRDRDRDRESAMGDQDRGSGFVRARAALPPNGQLKSQSNLTNIPKPCK